MPRGRVVEIYGPESSGKTTLTLQVIAEGKDPEGSSRASELILYIGAGILPDSTEEIKALVIEFSRSDADKKLRILRKLMQLGQGRILGFFQQMINNASTNFAVSRNLPKCIITRNL